MEAYKDFKKCRQEKLLFAQPTFAKGMDDGQSKILRHYSDINLDFLYEDEPDEDPWAKGVDFGSDEG